MTIKKAITIDELISEELAAMKARGRKPASIRSARQTYQHFLAFLGSNMQVRNITEAHLFNFMSYREEVRGDAVKTLNLRTNWLRNLFKAAVMNRYITYNPAARLVARKTGLSKTPVQRIPAADFPHLLASAPDPHSRMATAIGLFLFLRASELAALRVRDVDLIDGEVYVQRFKSSEDDYMPIPRELDAELRVWLKHYAENAGPLDPDWYLVPRRSRTTPCHHRAKDGTVYWTREVYGGGLYRPELPMIQPHKPVQRVLRAAGYLPAEKDGRLERQGLHTLRRSGARAYYDSLRANSSHDNVNRRVMTMLGHKNFTTTEIYLGIDADKAERNAALKGEFMFPELQADNVVQLRSASSGEKE